jgi:hypothetical protein
MVMKLEGVKLSVGGSRQDLEYKPPGTARFEFYLCWRFFKAILLQQARILRCRSSNAIVPIFPNVLSTF